MRKRIALIFGVILALTAVPGFKSALAADEDYRIVRVKLSVGTSASLSFFVDGNYTVGNGATAIARDQYTVKLEGGQLSLYCGSSLIYGGPSVKLVRHAATDGRNNFIWLYNAAYDTSYRYLGDMEFLIDESSIEVVNHVYIEDYLYGVVASEMGNTYPLEALKAQAIASRSYAEYYIKSSNSYDLVDTSLKQVYKGYDPSLGNAIQAVNDTANTVLTYNGQVIEALFCASNGGWTDIPYHRWGSGANWTYYQIVEDIYDTANTAAYYETIFFPADFNQRTVTTADNVTGTPDASKALAYVRQAILDSHQLDGYGVTNRDGFELIGVVDLTAHTYDISGVEDHSRIPVSGVNDCKDFIEATGDFNVLIGGITPVTVTDVTIDLRYLDGSLASANDEYKAFNMESLTLFVVSPVYEGETLIGFSISQKRFGHGCGLSQRGAQQRAGDGQTAAQILQFYYPGTTLATQTYTRPALTAVTVADATNASVVLTTATPLNVRSGPGTSYSKLGTLPNGARIRVTQASAATGSGYTWHKLSFAGQDAYVAVNYVQLDSYTIRYNLNGGAASNPESYTAGDTITLANPTKAGCSFAGWTGTGLSQPTMSVTIPAGSAGDREYTANWASAGCTVAFDAQGGSGVGSVQKNPGESIDAPPATSRPGYTFGGWYPTSACNTAPVSFPYTVTGSVTLYAGWIPQPQTAYLSGVSLSAGTLNRAFARTVYSYKVALGEYQESVTITPWRENDTAAVTINGRAVSAYTLSLANGKSAAVTVKVKFGKTSKTYKFTVTRAKSTNNNLASLTASAGAFDRAFDPAVTGYVLTLDENTKSVKIFDTVATSLAKASFKSKTVSLSNGQTKTVTVTVTAQSGAKKKYTITVTRLPSTNTGLKYLKTNSGGYPLTPAFSPGVASYTVTLPANKSSVTISARALGYKAAVYFDGAKRTSRKVTLAPGQSVTVRVTVVAQAGNAVDYYITITRP